MKSLFIPSFLIPFFLLSQGASGHAENDESRTAALLTAAGTEQSLQQDCPDPFTVGYRQKNHIACGDEITAPKGEAEAYVLIDEQEVTEGYTFNWYIGTEVKETPDFTGVTYTGLQAGTYSLEAIHNASGCVSALQQLTIEVEDYPYEVRASLVSANTGCENEAYNGALRASVVDADGNEYTEGDFTFTWYPAAVAGEAEHIIDTGATIEGLAAGEYSVIMTDNITACTSTATITVPDETVQPQLSLEVSQQIAQCDNPNAGEIQASLNVAGDYSMRWYRGEVVAEENRIAEEAGMSLSGYPAGIYTAQAINNVTLCVSTTETVEIEDLTASPEVEATLTHNTACDENLADGSIILSISTPLPGADPEGGYQVEWFLGAGSDGTPFEATGIILEGLAAGSYTAVVTNPESGCSSQHTFTIEDDLRVPALSLASVEPNTVCDPSLAAGNAYTGAISLELMQKGEAITEPSDYTISWYVLEGETEILLEENTALSREGLPAGRYKVVAVNQLSGCSSEELIVEVEEATQTPVVEAVNVRPLTHCDTPNGEIEVALEGDGEAGEYRIEWYQGNEVDADLRLEDLSDQHIVSGLAAGSYTVQGTHMETGCQSAPLTLVIEDATAAPQVTVESIPLTNCNPNRPDGAFSFNVDGETSGYSFVLYRGSEPDEAALVGEGSEIQGLREGQYLLVATDETTSCVSSSLVSIETGISFPEPPITIGAESCEAAELTLRVEGEGTYYWYTQPTGGNAFHAGNSLFRNFNQTTTYYVTAVNEDGCESRERSPVNALIHELEEPAIEANDNILSTTLDDSFSYQWYLDGELLAEETEHVITAETSGTYEVEVTNEAGCSRRSAPYEFTVSAVINKEYDAAIRVYPNPFQNQLHISLARGAGATNIRIMDSQMRQLRSLTITAKEELTILDLSALPQGIYYLEVREGAKVTYKRIARQ